MKMFKPLRVSAILSSLILIGVFSQLFAQDYYVFHLKNGNEVIGEAILDTLNMSYIIETMEGNKISIKASEIIKDKQGLYITNYEKVMLPPKRVMPPRGVDKCRIYSFFTGSLKGVALYTEEFYYGGEASIGVRISDFNIGFGAAFWRIKEVDRVPIFIYAQKYLLESCIRPYAIASTGYIFDDYTSDYSIKPALNKVFKTSPKFASIGIGVDFPVSKYFALIVETGYKYITITTNRDAASCDGPVPTLGYLEMHAAYVKLGLSF